MTAPDLDGNEVPVMHACGHDVHVACLLGASALLANARHEWQGSVVALFQPAEELGDGARKMVDDRLVQLVGHVDVALAQHVLPMPSGVVGTRLGSTLSAADSVRIIVHGRGAHGSMPQASVDPVVLAAMIVIRLQTVIAREIAPTDPAVLTVGSIQSGTKSNVIGDHAVLQLNVRSYNDQTRGAILDAIKRIVIAECQASRSPKDPEFELFDRFPPTQNDPATTARVRAAFDAFFGDRVQDLPLQTASEDFSDIPNALSVPYTTGASAESIPTPIGGRPKLGGFPKTSRSTTPRPSPRSFSQLSTPAPRPWCRPPSLGSPDPPGSPATSTPDRPGRPVQLLLRQAIVYYGSTPWTGGNDRRLRAHDLRGGTGSIPRSVRWAPRARLPRRWRPLGCLRGVATLTAYELAAEIGDWNRSTRRMIAAYLRMRSTDGTYDRRRNSISHARGTTIVSGSAANASGSTVAGSR